VLSTEKSTDTFKLGRSILPLYQVLPQTPSASSSGTLNPTIDSMLTVRNS